ncbi:hypothetical protein TB2_000114 [Malus domestica]
MEKRARQLQLNERRSSSIEWDSENGYDVVGWVWGVRDSGDGVRLWVLGTESIQSTEFERSERQGARKGRGIGSGKGKTADQGHKGQKARGSGKLGIEGGQTPLRRHLTSVGLRTPLVSLFSLNDSKKVDHSCYIRKQ